MADTDTNPEDHDEPFVSTQIPDDAPEADVLEQRQEVPDDQNEDEPWWDEDEPRDEDEVEYDEGE